MIRARIVRLVLVAMALAMVALGLVGCEGKQVLSDSCILFMVPLGALALWAISPKNGLNS